MLGRGEAQIPEQRAVPQIHFSARPLRVTGNSAKDYFEISIQVSSARDALTDDMVTRLSVNASHALDLLDRFNRSGIDRALPAVAQLVEDGDLERLVGLARLFGAAEDSLSDDIVNRLAIVTTGLASLVDKLARNEGFLHLVDLLGQDDVQASLASILGATAAARKEAAELPPAEGGFGGLWQLATDRDTQEAMRFLVLMSKRLS